MNSHLSLNNTCTVLNTAMGTMRVVQEGSFAGEISGAEGKSTRKRSFITWNTIFLFEKSVDKH